jgi:hypothetical protein
LQLLGKAAYAEYRRLTEQVRRTLSEDDLAAAYT